MIIVLNLHSGTKLAGWLRHCLGGRPPLATPLNTVMILHVVTTLFCQLCDNLVTTGLCWENLVTRLLFQLYSHYELVDGLLTDLLQVVGFVGAFSVLIPYFFPFRYSFDFQTFNHILLPDTPRSVDIKKILTEPGEKGVIFLVIGVTNGFYHVYQVNATRTLGKNFFMQAVVNVCK